MEVEEAELEEWIRSAIMSSYIPKCFFFSFVMKRSEYYSIHSDGATFLQPGCLMNLSQGPTILRFNIPRDIKS